MEIETSEYISLCSKKIIEEMNERGIENDIKATIFAECLAMCFFNSNFSQKEASLYLWKIKEVYPIYINIFKEELEETKKEQLD